MHLLIVTSALIVAATLVWSAAGKLRAPDAARQGVASMGFDGHGGVWISRVLPWAEIAMATALVLVPHGGTPSALFFIVTGILLARAVASPEPVVCACFGAESAEVTALSVLRNAGLTALAGLSAVASVAPGALFLDMPADQRLLTATAAGVAVAASAVFAQLGRLRRDMERYREEVTAEVLRVHRLAAGVEPDVLPLPPSPVALESGDHSDLAELASGQAALLVFAQTGCQACALFGPLVPDWAQKLDGTARVVVVMEGDPVDWTHRGPNITVVRSLLSRDARATIGADMVPAFMLLGTNRAIVTDPLRSDTAVDELVDAVLAAAPRPEQGVPGTDAPDRDASGTGSAPQ